MALPILYSFRRCPYAMRARYALAYAGISCIIREVDLKNKPEALIAISPKGTVPVLQCVNGDIIEESIEIVQWALRQKGDAPLPVELETKAQRFIQFNDTEFVKIIHKYKYRDSYPESALHNNEEDLFRHLKTLNRELETKPFILTDVLTKADIAVFPFVRQVVHIEPEKFALPSLQHLMRWLTRLLQSPLFDQVMIKYPVWSPHDQDVVF